MLHGLALLLAISANATVDLGARAELRSGAAAGYSDEVSSSLNLRLRPVVEATGHRPGVDVLVGYCGSA